MDEFVEAAVRSFAACIGHTVYLFIVGYPIIYLLFAMFGVNLWTFALAHLVIFVLWIIKPINVTDE